MSSNHEYLKTLSDKALVRQVVAASANIDRIIASNIRLWVEIVSNHGKKIQLEAENILPFDITNPERYLEEADSLRFWDEQFWSWLQNWEHDQISFTLLTSIIGHLSEPAVELDISGTELVRRYRNLPNVPEERIQGVLGRQRAVNRFLNSVYIGIELWIQQRPDGVSP